MADATLADARALIRPSGTFSHLRWEKGTILILLPLAGEGGAIAPDEGQRGSAGDSHLQTERRAFEGVGAAADLFDGAQHAAVAAEALIDE